MEALRLDGNAAAGLLHELFTVDLTAAVGVCAGCGAHDEVGAAHAYVSAGTVLRCRRCESVLLRVVEGRGRVWIDLRGFRTLQLPE